MTGKLKLAANKKTWLLVRDDGKEMQLPARALSRGLFPLNAEKHDDLEVEYELDKGQPARVRESGSEWVPSEPPPSNPNRNQSRENRGTSGGSRQVSQSWRPTEHHAPRVPLPGDFHNPYNFIPAPPRNTTDPDLGDHEPAGHDSYKPDLWSGHISVKLTTQTPLLIMDAAKAEFYKDDRVVGHKIFPVRIGKDRRPYLPPTSIKGMLRSAYEAITNSRFSVFEKHDGRLAFRMPAKIGPIPAVVETRLGQVGLRLMQAQNVIGFAAKLERYEERSKDLDKGKAKVALTYLSDRQLPLHGDKVWVQIDEKSRVTKIERRSGPVSPPGSWQPGWACITGPNINRKRYERVFLEGSADRFISIDDRHKNLWRELIENYQEIHKQDLARRKSAGFKPDQYRGEKPGETGWSRHIWDKAELELTPGRLCYVELLPGSSTEVVALYPVTISRRLCAASPADLLPDSLKPAESLKQFSPAERVFGWVNKNGRGAYRGNIRIGPVTCLADDAIDDFGGSTVPLAILGQPKPQQSRFYVAQSKKGDAQLSGQFKEEAGYLINKGLRGRKVYPHHAGLPDQYWANPAEDRTQQSDAGFFQEYRRPHKPVVEFGQPKLNEQKTGFTLKLDDASEQRDDQNRSIKGWVKPQVEFEFDIHVENLSNFEIGALLWLLTLPDAHFHRLGGGKSLGFGSVRLEVVWERSDVRQGIQWRDFYSTMQPTQIVFSREELLRCVTHFREKLKITYEAHEFEKVSFIAAFTRALQGFADGKPIHYPRTRQLGLSKESKVPPHPEGKSFEWFVANDRLERGRPKFGVALSDLENDPGLPVL